MPTDQHENINWLKAEAGSETQVLQLKPASYFKPETGCNRSYDSVILD